MAPQGSGSPAVLKVHNVHSWLVTQDPALHQKFWRGMRVRERGYFHKTAYKKGLWDGYRDFFDRKTGRFLTGLLPDVKATLKAEGVDYQVEDGREAFHWAVQPEDITPSFLGDSVTLYDYQVDYVRSALRFYRGLVTSPTASGKTYILISILKSLPPKTPVLFVTKAAGLVDQNYQEMLKWGIPDVGRYYDGYHEANYVMCVTSHPKTFEGIAKLLPKFKVLVVDEVHECLSDVPVAAYLKMTGAVARYGFSATPFKFASKDPVQKLMVKGHFGAVYKTTTTESGYLTTKDLQKREILSPSNCYFYHVDEPTDIRHEPYIDAVTLGIEENVFFHNLVARLARSLTGRTLILVERIDQGNYLKALLPEAHWISGRDKVTTRREVYGELKHGENVICVCMRHIITSGINVFVHNLINASGGQAEHATIQQKGRGLRRAPDKKWLDFYDFIFRTNHYLEKHSMNRIKTLAGEGHKVVIREEIDF